MACLYLCCLVLSCQATTGAQSCSTRPYWMSLSSLARRLMIGAPSFIVGIACRVLLYTIDSIGHTTHAVPEPNASINYQYKNSRSRVNKCLRWLKRGVLLRNYTCPDASSSSVSFIVMGRSDTLISFWKCILFRFTTKKGGNTESMFKLTQLLPRSMILCRVTPSSIVPSRGGVINSISFRKKQPD